LDSWLLLCITQWLIALIILFTGRKGPSSVSRSRCADIWWEMYNCIKNKGVRSEEKTEKGTEGKGRHQGTMKSI
jgi:hypothetical protein